MLLLRDVRYPRGWIEIGLARRLKSARLPSRVRRTHIVRMRCVKPTS